MARTYANIIPLGPDGQPTSNRLKYDPAFCEQVREMAQEGMMPEEWAANIGVTMATLYNWANKYPDFEEAIRVGWTILTAVYTRKFREHIVTNHRKVTVDTEASIQEQSGPKVNQAIFLEFMRKRFPSIYGPTPRGTFEGFEARNAGLPTEDGQPATPDAVKAMDNDAIQARLEELRKRRQHDPAKDE